MSKALCIHGHFYQPPRLDPWLGEILPEGSAAPSLNWNARIIQESYRPLGWAKRMDGDKITAIINAYEWISFNFGPTLLSYIETAFPEVYRRILQADALSLKRWGHGNALAQIYHHVIMPLASERDKKIETAWAVADFAARFGRAPEGMWLPEAAVDTSTLETLALEGIKFTILSPDQAAYVSEAGPEAKQPVNAGSLDISSPYLVDLPSGRGMVVFFYHGSLSQAVAFDKLLSDGENFYQRIKSQAGEGLLSLATDGETYGHHFPFGEMALAYVLEQTRNGRDGFELTNYAAYLKRNPPRRRVWLHEPSSWSCRHGVERWRSACGCSTGDHPDQNWRAPLRDGLNAFKREIDRHYYSLGKKFFKSPEKALYAYGHTLVGARQITDFRDQYLKSGLDGVDAGKALALLAMQQWALASFASCAWFFDDISRLEPVNSLTFALRAAELAAETGAADVLAPLLKELERAVSNMPEKGSGKDIFAKEVAPRQESPAGLIFQAISRAWADGRIRPGRMAKSRNASEFNVRWPEIAVHLELRETSSQTEGSAELFWRHTNTPAVYDWRLEWSDPAASNAAPQKLTVFFRDAPGSSGGRSLKSSISFGELAWNKRQAIAIEYMAFGAQALWREEQQRVMAGGVLFQNWQEAQYSQPRAWDWLSMWAGLAFGWITGAIKPSPEAEADFIRFVREAKPSPPPPVYLQKKLEEVLLLRLGRNPEDYADGGIGKEIVSGASFDAEGASAMLTRLNRLGIKLDLFPAQSVLWEMRPWDKALLPLAEALGFKI